ncbi:hypothetical protein F8388_012858 [Cannabis sativa]|uniref:Agenet domain-containing protein n=1 Tax=Cannabis sativa TaxID=3483 RepID=A0A7J6DMS2_CANSA|nr:hypothetical protein G4B88_021904 [Cannabis sativa]KAF4361398.1 hypothetical protein F8388_012858 [Cannabis sativa]KAF4371378.1 hypothetical protein G4B88_003848 [Cannabis sativa]
MGLLWKSATMRKGYEGSWFKAKIIESLADDNFWVEYKDLVTKDEVSQPLREKAERRHIRPEPPLVPPEDKFKFSEKVDAWYNDGWWEGEISKVLPFSSYNVYFKHTREEITFSSSHICGLIETGLKESGLFLLLLIPFILSNTENMNV